MTPSLTVENLLWQYKNQHRYIDVVLKILSKQKFYIIKFFKANIRKSRYGFPIKCLSNSGQVSYQKLKSNFTIRKKSWFREMRGANIEDLDPIPWLTPRTW